MCGTGSVIETHLKKDVDWDVHQSTEHSCSHALLGDALRTESGFACAGLAAPFSVADWCPLPQGASRSGRSAMTLVRNEGVRRLAENIPFRHDCRIDAGETKCQ